MSYDVATDIVLSFPDFLNLFEDIRNFGDLDILALDSVEKFLDASGEQLLYLLLQEGPDHGQKLPRLRFLLFCFAHLVVLHKLH